MKSISPTTISTPKHLSSISKKTISKPILAAYTNNIDFKDIIKKEFGIATLKNGNEKQNNAQEKSQYSKLSNIDNREYKRFLSSTNRARINRLNSKRFLKSFHPVPPGKTYAKLAAQKGKIHNANHIKDTTKNIETDTTSFNIKKINRDNSKTGIVKQISKYKEDQLLSNPGGDNFFLERQRQIIDKKFDHTTFSNRVGKDIFDSFSNLKNLAKDLGNGSEVKYFDEHGNIKSHKKVGFLKTISNFAKNMASGLSFGAYTPGNEEAPTGVAEKFKHFFKKVFVQSIGKDFFIGVPQSMINVGEDALFAGLNLVEIIPDATIGHTKLGRKITTQLFDNTQVGLDFATDIMPGGEASTRMKLSILKKFKNVISPLKWKKTDPQQYVRNTPFRNIIETLSFFIPFKG